MVEYYLVDVKSITSAAPRSQFRVDELETLAQSILASGGLLSPLLLKQTGAEQYEVLAGDREYYAALRAKEINPREAEMVHAFVIPPKQQEAAINQVAVLEAIPDTTPSPNSSGTDLRVTNLESRLDEALREIKQSQDREVKRLEEAIEQLKSQVPQRVEPLDAFNTLGQPELLQKLATANIRGKTAATMITAIEEERKKTKFTSFSNVVERVKGLGEKRMLSIIDAWGGLV
jgi:ParB-like chromosome segregation protein Spo0J